MPCLAIRKQPCGLSWPDSYHSLGRPCLPPTRASFVAPPGLLYLYFLSKAGLPFRGRFLVLLGLFRPPHLKNNYLSYHIIFLVIPCLFSLSCGHGSRVRPLHISDLFSCLTPSPPPSQQGLLGRQRHVPFERYRSDFFVFDPSSGVRRAFLTAPLSRALAVRCFSFTFLSIGISSLLLGFDKVG